MTYTILEIRQKPTNARASRQKYVVSNRCFEKISGAKRKTFFNHWAGRNKLNALTIFFFTAPLSLIY
jgi:hypothetical protein